MPNKRNMNSFRGLFKNKQSKASTKKESMPSFSSLSDVMGFEDDYDSSTSSKICKRNSICLNGLNTISTASSSDCGAGKNAPKKKTLFRSSSSSISTNSSSRAPDHRPLVGGFAAAAYEAARADFYAKQGIEANGHESSKSRIRSYLRGDSNTSFQ